MMASTGAKVVLHNLSKSDGSALYTSPNQTHTVQSSVHYPLEVPYRSDEIPNDTYVEVSLRPHNGVAMVKHRHIERMVQKLLKSIILGEETPRCMLQTTIQVMEVEADEDLPGGVKSGGQGEGYLDILVGAINASVLGCLDGAVQMKGMAGAVLIGITQTESLLHSPSVRQRKLCSSLHAFAFSSRGECLLMESEGSFNLEVWEAAEVAARRVVCGEKHGSSGANGDVEMNGREEDLTLFEIMRKSVADRVSRDERWKL